MTAKIDWMEWGGLVVGIAGLGLVIFLAERKKTPVPQAASTPTGLVSSAGAQSGTYAGLPENSDVSTVTLANGKTAPANGANNMTPAMAQYYSDLPSAVEVPLAPNMLQDAMDTSTPSINMGNDVTIVDVPPLTLTDAMIPPVQAFAVPKALTAAAPKIINGNSKCGSAAPANDTAAKAYARLDPLDKYFLSVDGM